MIEAIIFVVLLLPALVLLRLGWVAFDEWCWAHYVRSGRYVVRRFWRRAASFFGG